MAWGQCGGVVRGPGLDQTSAHQPVGFRVWFHKAVITQQI